MILADADLRLAAIPYHLYAHHQLYHRVDGEAATLTQLCQKALGARLLQVLVEAKPTEQGMSLESSMRHATVEVERLKLLEGGYKFK